jgi:hypothetical protein
MKPDDEERLRALLKLIEEEKDRDKVEALAAELEYFLRGGGPSQQERPRSS